MSFSGAFVAGAEAKAMLTHLCSKNLQARHRQALDRARSSIRLRASRSHLRGVFFFGYVRQEYERSVRLAVRSLGEGVSRDCVRGWENIVPRLHCRELGNAESHRSSR